MPKESDEYLEDVSFEASQEATIYLNAVLSNPKFHKVIPVLGDRIKSLVLSELRKSNR